MKDIAELDAPEQVSRPAPDVLAVELWYPGCEGHAETIEVGLTHVRSADGLRISYDFDRDGWVIKQASIFEWSSDDPVCDEDWQEVAFIKAWARGAPNP